MDELGHAMRKVYFPLERADMCISGLTHLGVRVQVKGTWGVFASKYSKLVSNILRCDEVYEREPNTAEIGLNRVGAELKRITAMS